MSHEHDESQILRRLKRVLRGRLAVDPDVLALDAKLAEVGIDSFSLVELMFVAEEEFNIKLPFDGLTVSTVGDVIALIDRQIADQRSA